MMQAIPMNPDETLEVQTEREKAIHLTPVLTNLQRSARCHLVVKSVYRGEVEAQEGTNLDIHQASLVVAWLCAYFDFKVTVEPVVTFDVTITDSKGNPLQDPYEETPF